MQYNAKCKGINPHFRRDNLLGFIKKTQGRISSRISKKSNRFVQFDIGFHGDKYLLQLVNLLLDECIFFIETGANVGSTLIYVAKKYPGIKCFSCEPDVESFSFAMKKVKKLENANLWNESSPAFLTRILEAYGDTLKMHSSLFWLDAHGYGYDWPLREEIDIITSNFNKAFILIDDFKVPGVDVFGYDSYNGQECSLDYIRDSFDPGKTYHIYYPGYTDKTSQHHPLRGWCMIDFGHLNNAPDLAFLKDKIHYAGALNEQ